MSKVIFIFKDNYIPKSVPNIILKGLNTMYTPIGHVLSYIEKNKMKIHRPDEIKRVIHKVSNDISKKFHNKRDGISGDLRG